MLYVKSRDKHFHFCFSKRPILVWLPNYFVPSNQRTVTLQWSEGWQGSRKFWFILFQWGAISPGWQQWSRIKSLTALPKAKKNLLKAKQSSFSSRTCIATWQWWLPILLPVQIILTASPDRKKNNSHLNPVPESRRLTKWFRLKNQFFCRPLINVYQEVLHFWLMYQMSIKLSCNIVTSGSWKPFRDKLILSRKISPVDCIGSKFNLKLLYREVLDLGPFAHMNQRLEWK